MGEGGCIYGEVGGIERWTGRVGKVAYVGFTSAEPDFLSIQSICVVVDSQEVLKERGGDQYMCEFRLRRCYWFDMSHSTRRQSWLCYAIGPGFKANKKQVVVMCVIVG